MQLGSGIKQILLASILACFGHWNPFILHASHPNDPLKAKIPGNLSVSCLVSISFMSSQFGSETCFVQGFLLGFGVIGLQHGLNNLGHPINVSGVPLSSILGTE